MVPLKDCSILAYRVRYADDLEKRAESQDTDSDGETFPRQSRGIQHLAPAWLILTIRGRGAIDLFLQLLDTNAGIVPTLITRQQGCFAAKSDVCTLLITLLLRRPHDESRKLTLYRAEPVSLTVTTWMLASCPSCRFKSVGSCT